MSQTQAGQSYYELNGKPFCRNCGMEIRPGIKFCNGCGTTMTWPQAQQSTMAQSPMRQPQTTQFASNPQQTFASPMQSSWTQPSSSGTASKPAQGESKPIRVIAMQKKFTLVACLKDLLLPGHGFIYTESMVEGAVVGLITIPLTVWAVLNYMQLYFTDLLNNLRNMGSSYSTADYAASDNFKAWLIGITVTWFIIRCIWLYTCVNEHNKKITSLADVNQLITFVDGK